jgi:hypothetical protein
VGVSNGPRFFGVTLQPSYEITIHPVDLSQFGKTPKGLPLYRVVWGDTRKSKLMYKGQLKVIPRYFPDSELNTGAHWILERWKSPEEFYGMSREQYSAMQAQFPFAPTEEWSADGDYDFEYGFEAEVDEAMLHKALAIREYRRQHVSLEERKAEAVAAEEKQEKRQEQEFTELYEEAREESFIQ